MGGGGDLPLPKMHHWSHDYTGQGGLPFWWGGGKSALLARQTPPRKTDLLPGRQTPPIRQTSPRKADPPPPQEGMCHGCRLLPILTYAQERDSRSWSAGQAGSVGDPVQDGTGYLFIRGRAHTRLTERWQALSSWYSWLCGNRASGILINWGTIKGSRCSALGAGWNILIPEMDMQKNNKTIALV